MKPISTILEYYLLSMRAKCKSYYAEGKERFGRGPLPIKDGYGRTLGKYTLGKGAIFNATVPRTSKRALEDLIAVTSTVA